MNTEVRNSNRLQVIDICRKNIVSCSPQDSVDTAIELMSRCRIGSILVCHELRPVGILTRRDAMRLGQVDSDRPLKLSDVMSKPVLTVGPETTIDELGLEFMGRSIRHAAVVSTAGELLGVVSESDIVNSQGLEHDLFLRSLSEVCNRDPMRLPSACTLRLAINRMRTADLTAALVETEQGGFQIITETDVISFLATYSKDLDRPLSAFGLNKLVAVPGELSLYNARRHFRKHGFRHLGVLSASGEVIGLASYSDILRNVEIDYVFRLRELLHDRSHSLQQTEHSLRLIEKVIDASMEGILITDRQGRIVSVNPAFTQITGYEEWEVLGCNPNILSSGRHDGAFYQRMWHTLQEHGRWQGEIWNKSKQGRVYPEWLSITAIEDERGEIHQYAAIFHDLTEVKRSEARMKKIAYFDEITQLANRRLLHDRLDLAITYAREQGTRIALLALDLDLFKRVNDRFGQVTGDKVLREIASRIESTVNEEETAARPGGDEFNLILTCWKSVDELTLGMEHLCKIISAPILVDNAELRISTSIGVAIYPDDGDTIELLLRSADTALAEAKQVGRNSFRFYSPELHQRAQSRYQMTSHLQKALDNRELVLFYQPKLCLKSDRIVGVEALIRWFSPELGSVSPGEFIPLAEDSGLIDEIGTWVLRESAYQSAKWRDQGFDLQVAANVSARQFQRHDVARQVFDLLEEFSLEPEKLCVELTETSFLHSAEQTSEALNRLREAGVGVSIDDFGTGYSSLNYIRIMSLNQLKIDLSFINNIEHSETDRKLVSAMIAMSHAMSLEVVAEGVENTEQLKLLREMGCDQAQGYLISRPLAEKELTQWMRKPLDSRLLA
ncbi:EAL domain-containing protein [Nitrincola alkalilacustris]|uniref:EAL domain-containing protein n=1 Tax=Nitrincola alkalilacustris TaxID=1571224 RepID=UPI00124C6B42|nr:EAL domain-containing protein [Nitrincola alkalilacustris]